MQIFTKMRTTPGNPGFIPDIEHQIHEFDFPWVFRGDDQDLPVLTERSMIMQWKDAMDVLEQKIHIRDENSFLPLKNLGELVIAYVFQYDVKTKTVEGYQLKAEQVIREDEDKEKSTRLQKLTKTVEGYQLKAEQVIREDEDKEKSTRLQKLTKTIEGYQRKAEQVIREDEYEKESKRLQKLVKSGIFDTTTLRDIKNHGRKLLKEDDEIRPVHFGHFGFIMVKVKEANELKNLKLEEGEYNELNHMSLESDAEDGGELF